MHGSMNGKIIKAEQRNIVHEISKLKANWIGHILLRNCLLQRVTEGKIKQASDIYSYRNMNQKLHKTIPTIWFNNRNKIISLISL